MEILAAVAYGLIGSAVMSALLYLAAQASGGVRSGIRGIGSAIPAPPGGSLVPGASVHFAAGAVLAGLYALLGATWGPLSPGGLLALGLGVGLLRALAVSLVLALLAMGEEPLAFIREAGLAVGGVHVTGSLVYGLCVSALYGYTTIQPALMF